MCPTAIIFAGQNGCGKSTLSRSQQLNVPLIDPDKFGAPNLSTRQRGRAILQELNRLEQGKANFALESTLSGKTILRRIASLQMSGYRVSLHYVSVQGQLVAQARVKQRVRLGGHDVPIYDQKRRFFRSFGNLLIASQIADQTTLYDNSSELGHTVFFTCSSDGNSVLMPDAPRWIKKFSDFFQSAIST